MDVPALVGQLQQANRAALSRLLTVAAGGVEAEGLAAALNAVPSTGAPVIAFTGSAGVGKSSLLGAVTARFAGGGERVGVLACDPASPLTGGALLGDRCRIAGTVDAEQMFIRSLAARPGHQALAENIALMVELMRRYPFNRIFVETVGAGQGDTAVRSVADIVVLVIQPQTGDELQWEKAGILEIADLIVVNKSDLAGADQTAAELTWQFAAGTSLGVPILKTSAARSEGIEGFCRALKTFDVKRAQTDCPH